MEKTARQIRQYLHSALPHIANSHVAGAVSFALSRLDDYDAEDRVAVLAAGLADALAGRPIGEPSFGLLVRAVEALSRPA